MIRALRCLGTHWKCLNERLPMRNHSKMASTSDSVLNPYGPRREKTCLWRFVNNKGADQPAHPCRLIRAFIIHLLENIISLLAPSEISLFWLVSVAKETGLILAFSESPKTGFLALRPLCEQPWLKQACTFMQSRQSLCFWHTKEGCS